jgi:hypothetical protein
MFPILHKTELTPEMFGWFHTIYLIGIIILTVILSVILRNKSEKFFRILLFIIGTILLLQEIFRQLIFGFMYTEEGPYQWYEFPFQACSTPIYVSLLASVMCIRPVFTSFVYFLGTYSLFAGLCVSLYTKLVFQSMIAKNNMSMVHHGILFAMGIAIIIHKMDLNFFTVLKAFPVFIVLITIAVSLDIWFNSSISETISFNMFFISPFRRSAIPGLENIRLLGLQFYPLVLFIYILVFTLICYLIVIVVWLIKKVILKIVEKVKRKREENEEEGVLFIILIEFFILLYRKTSNK